MPSHPAEPDFHRARRSVLLFGLIFAVLIVTVTALSIWKDWNDTDRDYRRNAANLTRLLLEQTDQLFASIDHSLGDVARELQRSPELLRAKDVSWLLRLRPAVHGFAFLFVLDANGRMVLSGDQGRLTSPEWSPRPPAGAELSNQVSVGAISRSRENEVTVVPLLRPFRGADGRLIAWVGAALDARYLLNYFRELDDGNIRINLRLISGEVVLRYPHRDDLIGRNLRPQSVFELVEKNEHGQYIDMSPVEHDLAFYDYRRSERFPYFVVIVRNVHKMFAGWRSSALIRVFIAILVLMAVGILVWAVWWHIGQAQREDRHLREVESQVRQSSRLQAIGRISSGLARDFNALLMIMYGQTEWLERRIEADDPAHQTLGKIRRTLNRARDLVRQVLALQKTDARIRQEVSLREIAAELDSFMRNSLPEGLRFELRASDPGQVVGDPNQIYQALLNLCANGLDAMRDRGGLLQMRIRRDPRGAVVLEVEDQGHGIAAKDLEKIFEPYYTTKGKGEGSGMGLSLVRSMADAHAVQLEVLSRVGQGTTFKLTWTETATDSPSPEKASGEAYA